MSVEKGPRSMSYKSINTRYTISHALQLAKETVSLLEGRRRELEPRLPEGLLDAFPSDITALEGLFTGREANKIDVKSLTDAEESISKMGALWVAAIREAVKKRDVAPGLCKAVGVGERLYSSRSAAVVAAIEQILKVAAESPGDLQACGVLDSDISNGQAILDDLKAARESQDSGMKHKKILTTEKNILQLRVEKAIKEIATAGYLQFMDTEPVIALRFKDLIPTIRRRKTAVQPPPIVLPKKETPVLEKLS